MGTNSVTGNTSRIDRWLGEYVEELLPWKRRAQAVYYEKRAESAKDSRNYDDALDYYDRAIKVRGRLGDSDRSVELGLRMAKVARKNGNPEVAKSQYERVVELYARRENAKGALDALEPMLEVLDDEEQDDELSQWWGHALMILGKAEPGEVSDQRRERLIHQYADQIHSEDSAGRLYGFALNRLLGGEDESGADLLEATWERRDVVREQVGQFRVVLAAGVGYAAYAELNDRDVDTDEMLEFVADYRPKLSDAAEALFERLSEGETDTDPEDLKSGVGPDDEVELREVEAEVFGRFLDELA
ncbi:tetratricopeptide repeat protein [Halorussus lipolyticus]|uniref:tetratricopeptide repeat protein n=1 Tax=Halorussus lipolyticus TaxID=3034024 RepID=UPI0023E80F28|nr:tetratricopeptide repeat protein [Halorussus sp. DT80]